MIPTECIEETRKTLVSLSLRQESHQANRLKYEARLVGKAGTSESRKHAFKMQTQQLELENTKLERLGYS